MDYNQINELIQRSLMAIHHADSVLIHRRVKEECINHRLAFYFETFFESVIHDDLYYSIDLEYNKSIGPEYKEIVTEKEEIIGIRPDIIIHKRKDNRSNLLAVEAKYHTLRNHDLMKLRSLLFDPYNYKFTAGISYRPDRDYFEYTLFCRNKTEVEINPFKIEKK